MPSMLYYFRHFDLKWTAINDGSYAFLMADTTYFGGFY